ncbi:TOBE domain-containing protein [Thermobaculum terrenum]
MGFVGQTCRVGDLLIRPHDVRILLAPSRAARRATVRRVARLGYDVRVDLLLEDGHELWAQLSRDELLELELAAGQEVFIDLSRARTFDRPEALPLSA